MCVLHPEVLSGACVDKLTGKLGNMCSTVIVANAFQPICRFGQVSRAVGRPRLPAHILRLTTMLKGALAVQAAQSSGEINIGPPLDVCCICKKDCDIETLVRCVICCLAAHPDCSRRSLDYAHTNNLFIPPEFVRGVTLPECINTLVCNNNRHVCAFCTDWLQR